MATRRPNKQSGLTDSERHKRFVDMAREVDASEDPKDFDKAFKKITETPPKPKTPKQS